MKKLLLFIIISIVSLTASSQNEGNIWYFGNNAGVSFNSSSPTALTNEQIFTREGCATMADKNGNLLFYSDGLKMYDNTHSVMPNSSGILGHVSSCQSALIIPYSGNTDKYFLITADAIENNATNGLRYSIIDFSLNGGKGDVVFSEKNIVLSKIQCEKAIFVKHDNNKDFWLISNQVNSDSILAFAVTSKGINKLAIRSNTGKVLSGDLNNNLGYLVLSHDGGKLASCHFLLDKVLVMDFDNQSGKVSNVLTLIKSCAYGAEFSPDNKILYVSGLRYPTSNEQYDISSNIQSTI